MYCSFCGKELSDGSRFCGSCGHAVANTPESERTVVINQTTATDPEHSRQMAEVILSYVFGALFIVGGILPYFIKDVNHPPTFDDVVSMIISIESIITSFSYAFSIICGMLFLKRAKNMYSGLKVCMVVQIITLILEIVLWAIDVQYSPYYEDSGSSISPRAVISFILVALAITAICLKKYVFKNNNNYNKKIEALGIYMMLSMFGLFSLFSSNLVYNYLIYNYGNEVELAAFYADAYGFGEFLSIVWLFVRFIYLCLVLLLNKKAKKFVPLSAAGAVVIIFGLVAILVRPTFIQHNFPEFLIEVSTRYFWFSLIGYAVMWIAVFAWDYAVVKGKLPKWVQIVVPILLPFICVLEALAMWNLDIRYLFNMILHLSAAIIILLVSVFVKKKSKARKASGQ